MYRAIVCIEEGHGALTGPNPVFRTEMACEEYWLARWYNLGPHINSFRIRKIGKDIEETRELRYRLIGRIMKMQQALTGIDEEEANELVEVWHNKPMELMDAQIAVLQEKLWEKKHKILYLKIR